MTELPGIFDRFAELIKVESDVNLCRDEKDNFLLNLAIDSRADYFVTGVNDLLLLEKIKNTKSLTFSEFIKLTK